MKLSVSSYYHNLVQWGGREGEREREREREGGREGGRGGGREGRALSQFICLLRELLLLINLCYIQSCNVIFYV